MFAVIELRPFRGISITMKRHPYYPKDFFIIVFFVLKICRSTITNRYRFIDFYYFYDAVNP